MMLDGLLRLRPMQTSDRSCASASYDSSSTGHRIIVGFRAVSAPMASALYVELCQKPGKSLPQFSDAKAVAAHRNSILLRFVFDIGERRPILEEFFVYQASPMRLIKLPACGHPLINPESNNMGIVCKEDGRDFVVAHLTVTQKETAESLPCVSRALLHARFDLLLAHF
ncbi:hypothetical protein PR202_gb10607 [Eleusine coracana subsp. coracana]|uniref:Uncharacterized protein n=1 Tax=Eleusine coracana subsp. coracana TaxID=191504 RepID=A0AAV5EI22_ELECO|nr:hypothetical protein PR202_gb10607 [Eleusine coracana subsp. coracana]